MASLLQAVFNTRLLGHLFEKHVLALSNNNLGIFVISSQQQFGLQHSISSHIRISKTHFQSYHREKARGVCSLRLLTALRVAGHTCPLRIFKVAVISVQHKSILLYYSIKTEPTISNQIKALSISEMSCPF